MRTVKKIVAVLAASVMVASLAACGGKIENNTETTTTAAAQKDDGEATTAAQQEDEPAAQKVITIGEVMQYTNSDPAHCYEGDLIMALHAVYDTLVGTDPNDESVVTEGIATGWTISEDNLTYVFTLRDDVVFTTGKTCTAEDVAYCLNRVKYAMGTPSFLMEGVESVEATGDFEVTVKLVEPNPAILVIFSEAMFGIYDSDVAKANGGTCDENDTLSDYMNSNPSFGSGPYQITTYESGNLMILEKNPTSVMRTAATDKIIIKNVGDPSTQKTELEGGEIDFALDLTKDQIDIMDGTEGLQTVTSATYDIFFLLLNRDPEIGGPVADQRVVDAINLAINYDELVSLCPDGTIVPSGIIQKGFVGYNGDNDTKQDLEAAKALLAEAGYPDGFELKVTTVSDMSVDGVGFETLATKVAADLAKIGITMQINAEAVSVYLEGYRDGTCQAVLGEWSPDYPDSNNQLAFLPGSTVGLRAGWTEEMSPELAALGKKAASTVDEAERAKLLQEVQDMMKKDSAFITLCQAGRAWEASSAVGNIKTSSSYYMSLEALTID